MISLTMVAALWAAGVYRLVLSIRSEKTVWRTAFTACVLGVALGATTSAYGDQTIDAWSETWNLALLLTRIALTASAIAASIYLVTLRHETVPAAAVRRRLVAGVALAAVQVLSWNAAPIHDRELATTGEVNQSSLSGALFAAFFALALVVVTVEVALFCFSRAASRIDPTRTISLLITGTACAAGAALFALGVIGVLSHLIAGVETSAISGLTDAALPVVAVVLALGTLSLLFMPPVLDLAQSYLRWRSVRPLWADLIRLRPEVHLDVQATGSPRTRLQFRLHRAIVEIHDALRVTPVAVPPTAGVHELARALHAIGGSTTAADVLAQSQALGADDTDRLLALARSYSRS